MLAVAYQQVEAEPVPAYPCPANIRQALVEQPKTQANYLPSQGMAGWLDLYSAKPAAFASKNPTDYAIILQNTAT